jgi:dihydroxyacid dehydratase/phosphogluconate dehydratase
VIEAPARVFHSQDAVKAAFKAGEFTSDTVVVVRFQGPQANGMPELHSLTPTLSVLQDRGLKVALVTDGRMSGASARSRRRSMSPPRPPPVGRWRNCATATSSGLMRWQER